MTTAPNAAGSVSPPNGQTRKGLGKWSTLLGQKASHVNDHYIELDDPHKPYYAPGEIIKGTVVLNVARTLGILHMTLTLYGFVEVFKNHSKSKTSTRSNGVRVGAGNGKRWVSEYYGDGFATLFEDEQVLCGDGALAPNLYHFKFEAQFPTKLSLPSSIEFERGTVTYMLSSTITRGRTAMSGTMTCEQKVNFRDRIDVGKLPHPKPRMVTFEPVENSSKARNGVKRITSFNSSDRRTQKSSGSTTFRARTDSGNTNTSDPSAAPKQSSSDPDSRPSRAGSPSQRSTATVSSDAAQEESRARSETRSSGTSHSPIAEVLDQEDERKRSIKLSVDVTKAGTLPGDIVPVQIHVQHFKPVRSLNGIVATLYRQARVDMHPDLPLRSEKGKAKKQYEDYYPRSRTGLGGLSLSAAGSSQVWRKDLSQTFAHLIVNPATMSADTQLLVRIPDDAFPSIQNTPGSMITFSYTIEVVIDIHGKLANQDRFPSLNITDTRSINRNAPGVVQSNHHGNEHMTVWGANCVDTSSIRRDRHAFHLDADLVIGTKDSFKNSKRRQDSALSNLSKTQSRPTTQATNGTASTTLVSSTVANNSREQISDYGRSQQNNGQDAYGYNENNYNYDHGYGYEYDPNYDYSYDGYYDYSNYDPNYHYYYYPQPYNYPQGFPDGQYPPPPHHPHATPPPPPHPPYSSAPPGPYPIHPGMTPPPPPPPPPPNMPDTSNLTEKQRLKLAESTLLESAPPGEEDDGEPSAANASAPSAPPDLNGFAQHSQLMAAQSVAHRDYASPSPPPQFPNRPAQASQSPSAPPLTAVFRPDGESSPSPPISPTSIAHGHSDERQYMSRPSTSAIAPSAPPPSRIRDDDPIPAAPASCLPPTDDKAELERRRKAAQQFRPDIWGSSARMYPSDSSDLASNQMRNSSAAARRQMHEESEIEDAQAAAGIGEPLPKYEGKRDET